MVKRVNLIYKTSNSEHSFQKIDIIGPFTTNNFTNKYSLNDADEYQK